MHVSPSSSQNIFLWFAVNIPHASNYTPLIILVSDPFGLFSVSVPRFWKMLIVSLRAQTDLTISLTLHFNRCFRWAVRNSLVTRRRYSKCCKFQCLWDAECEYPSLRIWVILVPHIKIVGRWCQRHLGFGFIFWSAAAFTVWPHQPHHECDSAQVLQQTWCGLLSSGTAAADHAWRSVWRSVIQNLSACKGSFREPIRWQIKLWVSRCWLIQIGAQQNTEVCRRTTRHTCGGPMETMTHRLLFVAIDTPVFPFKWERRPHWDFYWMSEGFKRH